MIQLWQNFVFETLYTNRYLYRIASTIPFAGQWRSWQQIILSRLQGHSVLELGCGLGDLMADMIDAGYSCRAIEKSPEMVDAARSTLQQRYCGSSSDWIIQGQAQHLPFLDATFDNVVTTFPSDYIYDHSTISEVERVLRPGGRLVIVLGARLLPVGLIQPFLLLIQMFVYGPAVLCGLKREERFNSSTGILTKVLLDAEYGKRIPLEQHGLCRRSEHLSSQHWEAFVIIGEKSAVNSKLVFKKAI